MSLLKHASCAEFASGLPTKWNHFTIMVDDAGSSPLSLSVWDPTIRRAASVRAITCPNQSFALNFLPLIVEPLQLPSDGARHWVSPLVVQRRAWWWVIREEARQRPAVRSPITVELKNDRGSRI